MIPADELAAMRDTTGGLHTDEVTITRPSSSTTLDTTRGVEVPAAAAAVYTGVAMVSPINVAANTTQFGERPVTARDYLLRLPSTVTDVRKDDRVEVTRCANDASLVGRVLRIVDVHRGTLLIDRVALCEDVE